MSKKNQKRKKEMKEQQGCPRPWRQIDDVVVDAHGRIVKAPHGCSWEGDNYNDGAAAAQIIVAAVNNSQQPQPVPEWQPIETAPTDGATFIAWSPAYKGIFVAAIHGANSWWSPGLGHMSMDHALFPTHWMPLPVEPKPGGDQ